MIDEIIKANQGLVYKYLHLYNGANNPDMNSFAFEALARAAATYDSSKGYAFSTYASTCIRNAIGCYLRTLKNKPIEVPYEDYMRDVAYYAPSEDTSRLYAIIKDVIEELPEAAREIAWYFVDSEFTAKQREIVDALCVSQSKVSNVLSEFKKRLKQEVQYD